MQASALFVTSKNIETLVCIDGEYNKYYSIFIMANTFKTGLLLVLLSTLFLIIGRAIGGQGGLVVAFIFAVVMNFGSYWFSDKVVLRMYKATEVGLGHPLHEMTVRLARQANLPLPRVYVIPTDSPNAFATGRNAQHAAVAATEGIIRLLDERELEGVIAHELAHIKHRDILICSVTATVAAAIMMLANMAQWAAIFGGFGGRDRNDSNPIGLLIAAVVAPVAAMMIQMAISRSREFAADRAAATIVGNPFGLADALKKIDTTVRRVPFDANPATAHMFIMKPFSGRGVSSLFSTHPSTDQRIKALLGQV